MTVLVISRSKFFREALKLIISDMVDEIDVSDRIHRGDKVYDLILWDLESLYGEPQIEDRVMDLKAKGSKVVVFAFDPADRFRDTINKIGADGYIHRPLDPRTVREAISGLD